VAAAVVPVSSVDDDRDELRTLNEQALSALSKIAEPTERTKSFSIDWYKKAPSVDVLIPIGDFNCEVKVASF
jgi:hypothetical protein